VNVFRILLYFIVICPVISSYGQTDKNLVAHFSFDSCNVNEKNNVLKGQTVGSPVCECGVSGSALKWSGGFNFADWEGTPLNNFFANDFSVSFYFKPDPITGTIDILSKRENCGIDSLFAIRYVSDQNTIVAELVQRVDQNGTLSGKLPANSCWYHVVFIKSGNRLILYINGEEKGSRINNYTIILQNKARLALANSPCLTVTDRRFAGSLDELKLFNKALNRDEIKALYVRTDHLATRDTVIFKGGRVPVRFNSVCPSISQWSPIRGVSDPNKNNPFLTPDSTTNFVLKSTFGSCTVRDTLKVIVIDAASLDCENVNLPNAFTPNADGLNDVFRINNPYVIESLQQFEIFDRWGEKVFGSNDALGYWDGIFRSQPVNPGIFIYHLKYTCQGTVKHKSGSLTLIR